MAGWLYRLAQLWVLLAAAPALAQTIDQASRPSTASAWSALRFNLTQLAPDATAAVTQAMVGADLPFKRHLVGSIEADERRRGAATTTSTIAPVYQREADISGRLGLLVGDGSLLFGRVGYSEYDLEQAFTRGGSRGRTAGGVLVGAGAETRLSSALSVRTEYQSVDYAAELASRRVVGGLALRY